MAQGLVLAGTSKLMCLRACVLGKTGLQNHSKMQAVSRRVFKVLLNVYERRTRDREIKIDRLLYKYFAVVKLNCVFYK